MASTINSFIKKQPDFLRKGLYKVIPFKYRYGVKYLKFLELLEKAKGWSNDEARNYQLEKLRIVLRHADHFIPYYQDLFKDNGFDINIKDFDSLKNLPFLTKDLVNENYSTLINHNYHKKTYKTHSSGTSGKRIDLLCTDDLFKIEAAFINNAFLDHGAKLYDNHSIWIRRYSAGDNGPIFFRDYELNRSYLSVFHLNQNTFYSFLEYIDSTKAEILVSYPSTLYYFSLLCESFGVKPKYIKYLHGASEMCLPNWSEKIKEILGIEIKMHYGQVEKVSFAHQGESNLYKENLLYSYNEFLDDGSIIGTGFYNEVMPLIRYKTEDKIQKTNLVPLGAFPETINSILGRNGDMLISESGAMIPAVNFYSFLSKFEEIDMFQIKQKKEDKSIEFYVASNLNFNKATEQKLYNEMRNRLGNIQIQTIFTKEFQREKSGKFKAISLE